MSPNIFIHVKGEDFFYILSVKTCKFHRFVFAKLEFIFVDTASKGVYLCMCFNLNLIESLVLLDYNIITRT